MSGAEQEPEPGYHLLLSAAEVPLAATALRLLISDEAHEPQIRGLAREVIEGLEEPTVDDRLTLALTPEQMKITYSAVKLMLNDMQRDQASEREILREILQKLPDEHTMRAIQLS